MEKTIIDERNGWEYELQGDYYYPTGRVKRSGKLHLGTVDTDNGAEEEKSVGVWAQRHLRYIKHYKKNLYFDLFVTGRLNEYLTEIEAQAEDMFFRVVKEMTMQEGLTELLKAEDQLLWVQRSNNIYTRAREIVNSELIYN